MTEAVVSKPAPELEVDENLGFLIHETAQAITLAYGTVMAPLGLTRPQVRVLVWVDHSPGITQTELCGRISSSPMAMTGLLDRMESKDLVKRVDDPNDRRVKRIYLTNGALRLKPEMERIADDFRKAMRRGLAPQDIATAVNVLKSMQANLLTIKAGAQADR